MALLNICSLLATPSCLRSHFGRDPVDVIEALLTGQCGRSAG